MADLFQPARSPKTGQSSQTFAQKHRPASSDAYLLDALRRKRIAPVIPSRADQPANPDFDREAYHGRNLVERLVGKLKHFRRVATRYDKLAAHYLAFVQLASTVVWLRDLAGTA